MTQLLNKCRTFFGLLTGGDHSALRRRVIHNWMLCRARLAGQKPFVYRKKRIRYVCYPQEVESWVVSNLDLADPIELELLRRWMRPGDTVVDGGANCGAYTAASALFVGRRGCVLAVEAGSRLVKQLEQTAQLLNYPQIKCVHAALGDEEGEVEFFEALPGNSSFGQSLRLENGQERGFAKCRVHMTTLSKLATSRLQSVPAAVKIDVEGAEERVLDGAPEAWFEATGPLWIIEVNPSALALFDATPAQVAKHFPPEKFERLVLPKAIADGGGDGCLRRLVADESWSDATYFNLIAIPTGPQSKGRQASIRPLLASI